MGEIVTTHNPEIIEAWEIDYAKQRLKEEREAQAMQPANILESIATMGAHPLQPIAESLIENHGSVSIRKIAKETGIPQKKIKSLGILKGTFVVNGRNLETPLIPKQSLWEKALVRAQTIIDSFPLRRPATQNFLYQASPLWNRSR